jgi:cell division protein FtsZ
VVIATGFDKRGGGGGGGFDAPSFEPDPPSRSRSQTRRTPVMDDRQRSSLEIPDDDIDIPSFLKD